MIHRRSVLLLLAGSILASGLAAAQTPPAPGQSPVRLRGTIDSVTSDGLELTTRGGSRVHVQMGNPLRVTLVVKDSLSNIQPGNYIGTAAVPQPDGTLRALEVHVFPPNMRGTGEGSRPWDTGGEGASMTNGTVGTLVGSAGRTATVKYGDGEKQIVIPDDVPVVTLAPGDSSALTVGAKVIVAGHETAGGIVIASSINVGKDGLVPPM